MAWGKSGVLGAVWYAGITPAAGPHVDEIEGAPLLDGVGRRRDVGRAPSG